VTSDPNRVDGRKAGRLEEFLAEDVFLARVGGDNENEETMIGPGRHDLRPPP
jgi:hypothetical protein